MAMIDHMSDSISLEQLYDGQIAILYLNNPESKNSMTLDMGLSFHRELHRLASADPMPRAVIITGKNGLFSSGGDLGLLRSFMEKSQKDNEEFMESFSFSLDSFSSSISKIDLLDFRFKPLACCSFFSLCSDNADSNAKVFLYVTARLFGDLGYCLDRCERARRRLLKYGIESSLFVYLLKIYIMVVESEEDL